MAQGCVCPPTCELTCKATTCPRQPLSNEWKWIWQEAVAKAAYRARFVEVLTWEEGRHRGVDS